MKKTLCTKLTNCARAPRKASMTGEPRHSAKAQQRNQDGQTLLLSEVHLQRLLCWDQAGKHTWAHKLHTALKGPL